MFADASETSDHSGASIAAPGPSLDLDFQTMRSRDEFFAARTQTEDRLAFERLLSESLKDHPEWSLPGVCQACDAPVRLAGDWEFSDGRTINFRERLICPFCGLNNRQRFMAHLVRDALGDRSDGASVYLYEQITAFFRWAERALPAGVVGSEYLGHDVAAGAVIEGVRHEDALNLSFDDGSLDVIVSNDVFEHVPDIERSLAECARVLRDGGRLFFTIPFHPTEERTVRRAELRGGGVAELLPPQYHGNPLSEEGSLVFYDYGWDIFESCRAVGFRDAYLVGYWSLLYGYLGGGMQPAFVAER